MTGLPTRKSPTFCNAWKIFLATNMKNNMDDAFARRFQSMIYFPLPPPEQRRLLWKSAFSRKTKLARDIDLDLIASEHEVSGGQIVNVVRHASLAAAESGTPVIRLKDILAGIQRERKKEGRLP